MLNEIIKTAEELNTAALYYRQSGNMDGVRELAKAHAVSKNRQRNLFRAAATGWLIYRLRKERLRMRLKNCVQKCLP